MKLLFSVILGITVSAFGQHPPQSFHTQSSGACSPNIISNQGLVQFTCNTSIDAETSKKIVSLLNQILKKEGGATNTEAEINHKLDEILSFVRSQTPRRISDEEKVSVSACLSKYPGKVNVAAITNSPEAYRFAQDWYEIFKNAGWTIKDNMIHNFVIGGGMFTGTQIGFRGEWIDTTKQYRIDENSPEASLVGCLKDRQIAGGGSLIGHMDTPTGEVSVMVGPQPQQ